MKSKMRNSTGILRRTAWMPAVLMLVFLGGCLEKHLVWSPDGTFAAVIAKDGLHLCDPDGKLTPLLLSGVDHVAWFDDSRRMAVARTRSLDDWTSVAKVIGSARVASVTREADAIWSKWEAGGSWSVLTMAIGQNSRRTLVKILLRDKHADTLRTKLNPGDWDSVKSEHVDLAELLTARMEGNQILPGPVLYTGLEKIEDIRLSPGDQAIAFTTDQTPDDDDESRLMVALAHGGGATTVAERTAAYPDWTPDARSLVYVQAAAGGKKDIRLATLIRREVLSDRWQIKPQENHDELAGMVFSNLIRVRCLKDGRILFNSAEFNLPMAERDVDTERERLFVLDPARQSTLVRLIPRGEEENMPKNLTFFEPSPDQRRLLVGGFDGEVSVLTIATGEVGVVQKAGDNNLLAAPVWRNDDEITYARRNPAEGGKQPARKAEIVLQKLSPAKGDHETVLSREWSDDMLANVFSPSDRK
jgi:hypothetical protein